MPLALYRPRSRPRAVQPRLPPPLCSCVVIYVRASVRLSLSRQAAGPAPRVPSVDHNSAAALAPATGAREDGVTSATSVNGLSPAGCLRVVVRFPGSSLSIFVPHHRRADSCLATVACGLMFRCFRLIGRHRVPMAAGAALVSQPQALVFPPPPPHLRHRNNPHTTVIWLR